MIHKTESGLCGIEFLILAVKTEGGVHTKYFSLKINIRFNSLDIAFFFLIHVVVLEGYFKTWVMGEEKGGGDNILHFSSSSIENIRYCWLL